MSANSHLVDRDACQQDPGVQGLLGVLLRASDHCRSRRIAGSFGGHRVRIFDTAGRLHSAARPNTGRLGTSETVARG